MFSQHTVDFLADLRKNNNREWFEENRDTYHVAVRDAAREFGETLSSLLEAHGHGPVTPKIFRINRDLRFSKERRLTTPMCTWPFDLRMQGPMAQPGWSD